MIRNPKPRERILEAACGLFHKRGLQGASVDEIAHVADSNKMTLYRHFGSKKNLAVACLHSVIEEIDAKWREIEARPDNAGKLDEWIGRMTMGCTGSDARSELIFAIFRQARGDAAARPLLSAFMARHKRRLTGICRAAGIVDAGTLGTALMALAYGMRANPWGLSDESRRVLFASLAGTLVNLFRSSAAKTSAARPVARGLADNKRRPPRPLPRPRERILAAACVLFHKHGIQGANVDEIAAAADSNKMTLYRHFGSKEKLAGACFKAALEEAEAILGEIETLSPGDPLRQMYGFIGLIAKALAGSDRRTERIGMAMQAMRSEPAGQALMREFELKERKWLARICRSLGIAEPDALADIVLLVMHGTDANPWGLGRAQLGAQYFSTANAIVRSFMTHPRNLDVGRVKRHTEPRRRAAAPHVRK